MERDELVREIKELIQAHDRKVDKVSWDLTSSSERIAECVERLEGTVTRMVERSGSGGLMGSSQQGWMRIAELGLKVIGWLVVGMLLLSLNNNQVQVLRELVKWKEVPQQELVQPLDKK